MLGDINVDCIWPVDGILEPGRDHCQIIGRWWGAGWGILYTNRLPLLSHNRETQYEIREAGCDLTSDRLLGLFTFGFLYIIVTRWTLYFAMSKLFFGSESVDRFFVYRKTPGIKQKVFSKTSGSTPAGVFFR